MTQQLIMVLKTEALFPSYESMSDGEIIITDFKHATSQLTPGDVGVIAANIAQDNPNYIRPVPFIMLRDTQDPKNHRYFVFTNETGLDRMDMPCSFEKHQLCPQSTLNGTLVSMAVDCVCENRGLLRINKSSQRYVELILDISRALMDGNIFYSRKDETIQQLCAASITLDVNSLKSNMGPLVGQWMTYDEILADKIMGALEFGPWSKAALAQLTMSFS